jgi:hypothetical protein
MHSSKRFRASLLCAKFVADASIRALALAHYFFRPDYFFASKDFRYREGPNHQNSTSLRVECQRNKMRSTINKLNLDIPIESISARY